MARIMIDRDSIISQIRDAANKGLDWKEANRLIDYINKCPMYSVDGNPKLIKRN